jgi:hypothetical protein
VVSRARSTRIYGQALLARASGGDAKEQLAAAQSARDLVDPGIARLAERASGGTGSAAEHATRSRHQRACRGRCDRADGRHSGPGHHAGGRRDATRRRRCTCHDACARRRRSRPATPAATPPADGAAPATPAATPPADGAAAPATPGTDAAAPAPAPAPHRSDKRASADNITSHEERIHRLRACAAPVACRVQEGCWHRFKRARRRGVAVRRRRRYRPPSPLAANEVTVRIRKLGGADGKQLLNQIHVDTPIGDEFSVTEQVGITQLTLRGKVILLPDGKYRVNYEYAETSPGNAKQMKSTWEMPPDTEQTVGGFLGEAGAETILITVSRTLNPTNDTLRSPLPSGGCDLKPVRIRRCADS